MVRVRPAGVAVRVARVTAGSPVVAGGVTAAGPSRRGAIPGIRAAGAATTVTASAVSTGRSPVAGSPGATATEHDRY